MATEKEQVKETEKEVVYEDEKILGYESNILEKDLDHRKEFGFYIFATKNTK